MESITLLDGGTTSTTGGTAKAFSQSSEPVANGKTFVDASETDFFAREKITCISRLPSQNTDGTWSKQKSKVQKVYPEILADGTTLFHIGRNEIEVHPLSADAAAMTAKIREDMAQLYKDSELTTFYTIGTI